MTDYYEIRNGVVPDTFTKTDFTFSFQGELYRGQRDPSKPYRGAGQLPVEMIYDMELGFVDSARIGEDDFHPVEHIGSALSILKIPKSTPTTGHELKGTGNRKSSLASVVAASLL